MRCDRALSCLISLSLFKMGSDQIGFPCGARARPPRRSDRAPRAARPAVDRGEVPDRRCQDRVDKHHYVRRRPPRCFCCSDALAASLCCCVRMSCLVVVVEVVVVVMMLMHSR